MQQLPLAAFHKSRSYKDGLQYSCRDCRRKLRRASHARNPNLARGRQRRSNLTRYGLTVESYDSLFERQGGLCAICRRPERAVMPSGDTKRRLAVDHCHTTGQVRALLCLACNTTLGKFEDDPDRLERAAEYLRSHQMVAA